MNININNNNIPYRDYEIDIINYFIKFGLDIHFFWGNPNEIESLEKIISNNDINKIYLILFHNDFTGVLDIPDNFILYRTSLYKSNKKYNEFILPVYYSSDIRYSLIERLQPVSKTIKPKICFSGAFNTYHSREGWANFLNESELLDCNIIDKGTFRGGTIEDLIENFKTSEFCFCPRGAGNFSIRFYEALYYGRIPVVIDTDILLPFSNEIEWNKYIVISNKIEELPEKIYNFWLDNDIEFIQNECRKIYQKYFTLKNISNHMYKEIKNIYEDILPQMSVSYRNYNLQWLNIGDYFKNKNHLDINDIVFGGKFISNKVIYHGKYINIDNNLELEYFKKSRNYTLDIMSNIKYDLILVLGSGYGRNIFYYLYNYKYIFSGIDIISGEITKNGIEVQEYIKDKYFKEEKIKILKFDYNNSTEFFKNIENKYKNILVLTFSSIQEITYINDLFFENLINLPCEKLKCINIEPIGWQITDNSLMKENTDGYRSYYNKNLFQKLIELQRINKLLINNVIVDFFNFDIAESCCSLIEWEKK